MSRKNAVAERNIFRKRCSVIQLLDFIRMRNWPVLAQISQIYNKFVPRLTQAFATIGDATRKD